MLLLCFEEGNRASCLWERERILGLSFLLFPASRFYCFHFYLGKGSFHACSLFEASKDSFVCYRILLIMKMEMCITTRSSGKLDVSILQLNDNLSVMLFEVRNL
ncbi:uncharacterized protein LOC127120113 isoform X2 [Lathyrus oleraceus]|uniref:uncharacterized protein LOC127120107 isoform X7 n=1 Tax=Pisum sativum TaxID=3888 RepID=UPI0021CDFEC3|nr:uncharacterized protein LOC127120107 isoform X7 [Pisum sativum]XP_050906453.1 uncharacterized protein LOC127120108 isoform X2 [Pisum sativum]XP_050906457.1 uncharacterized protein LOC127120111 isoform X2 [Pisum sativum]XP_050906460.1 uncharacterized protein LOC127120112 isoform X2 [Pisum sativum]XP_050906462.1 uncharacterized protein LOC127120113 isoform X2 [Pisum sativum]